jgi:hypothetical protein
MLQTAPKPVTPAESQDSGGKEDAARRSSLKQSVELPTSMHIHMDVQRLTRRLKRSFCAMRNFVGLLEVLFVRVFPERVFL